MSPYSQGINIDICTNGCGGIFFDNREFKIFDEKTESIDEIKKALEEKGMRVEVDGRSEKIGYKIREAQLEKVPYMVLAGDKDIENNTISIRSRKNGDEGATTLDEFITRICDEIEAKAL